MSPAVIKKKAGPAGLPQQYPRWARVHQGRERSWGSGHTSTPSSGRPVWAPRASSCCGYQACGAAGSIQPADWRIGDRAEKEGSLQTVGHWNTQSEHVEEVAAWLLER